DWSSDVCSSDLAATVVSLCFYVGLEGSLLRQTGPVFQGRYLLPLAMGIVMLAGRGVDESAPERRRRLLPALGVVVGITAAAQLVAIWFGARRFAVGSDGAVWFVGDARWQPDIPQAVSLLVAVVAITGLRVWVWTAARGDAARERARTVRA